MHVRTYRTDDWEGACEIYNLGKPDELRGLVDPGAILPLEADREMKLLFDASRIVVMEAADRIIGFAGSRGSHITWLFVHPHFRRRGVGTALVHDLLGRLAPPVTLNVAVDNAPARALYERAGFKIEQEFIGEFQGARCRVARLRYEASMRGRSTSSR